MIAERKPRPSWVHQLVFGLEVSLRYHKAREAHLSGYLRFVSWINVVGGSAVVGNLIGTAAGAETLILGVGFVLTALNGHVVTSGIGERQRLHAELAKRFSELQFRIEKSCEDSDERLSEAEYRHLRREIEQDEPAIYCALQDVKYNEVAVSCGYGDSHLIKVTWIKRLLRNIYRFERECSPEPEDKNDAS